MEAPAWSKGADETTISPHPDPTPTPNNPPTTQHYPPGGASHVEQALPALWMNLPTPQGLQAARLVAPMVDEVPAGHVSQRVAPACAEYLPGLHWWHDALAFKLKDMDEPGRHGVLSAMPPLHEWPTGHATPDAELDPSAQ